MCNKGAQVQDIYTTYSGTGTGAITVKKFRQATENNACYDANLISTFILRLFHSQGTVHLVKQSTVYGTNIAEAKARDMN
jgi:hypothetical protein